MGTERMENRTESLTFFISIDKIESFFNLKKKSHPKHFKFSFKFHDVIHSNGWSIRVHKDAPFHSIQFHQSMFVLIVRIKSESEINCNRFSVVSLFPRNSQRFAIKAWKTIKERIPWTGININSRCDKMEWNEAKATNKQTNKSLHKQLPLQ